MRTAADNDAGQVTTAHPNHIGTVPAPTPHPASLGCRSTSIDAFVQHRNQTANITASRTCLSTLQRASTSPSQGLVSGMPMRYLQLHVMFNQAAALCCPLPLLLDWFCPVHDCAHCTQPHTHPTHAHRKAKDQLMETEPIK